MKKSKQVVRVDEKSTGTVKVSNHDTKGIMAIVGIALGVIAFIAACIVIGYESFHVDPVMTVDGKKYTINDPEVKYALYMSEASLQNAGATYGMYMGMDAATYFESNKASTKDSALSSIEEVYLMYNEALKNNETLSDDEKKKTEEEYGKIYDKMSKTRRKRLDMSKKVFIEQAERVQLAYQYIDKVTKAYGVTKDNLTTKVDKAQYDERKFQVIQVPLTTTDKDGKSKNVTAAEKSTYTKKMGEFLNKAKAGTALDKIVTGDDTKTYTYEEKSLLTTDETFKTLMSKIKNMKNKEVFNGVIEADNYLFVVKMIDNKVTTQYDQAVDSAISTEQNTKLQADIDKLKKEHNLSVGKGWDKVEIGTVAVFPGDSLDEFQPDETETKATATPAATAKASATPKATASPKATKKAN